MAVLAIIGVAILLIAIYATFKLLRGLISALILLGLALFAFYLIFGSIPQLKAIPIIGPFLPTLPTTPGEMVGWIRQFFYGLEISGVGRDATDNMLVVVKNTGRLDVSGFKVLVDGRQVRIVNEPTDPLKAGQVTVLQLDWKAGFRLVRVETDQAVAEYKSRE
jgi:hypothetical protein